MASPSSVLPEDYLQCSVCLDVFTDPVSTPCGHSFCKSCVSNVCQCPLCKKRFRDPLDLRVNVALDHFTREFKRRRVDTSEQCAQIPGEVTCDICPGRRRRAMKTCLPCHASYCDDHAEAHAISFGEHQLVHPAIDLGKRTCEKHDRPLELFCSLDQTCICALCAEADHETHVTVPIEEEWTRKKTQLRMNVLENKQEILDRQRKLEEIKQVMGLSRRDAERQREEGKQVFTTLKDSIERCQSKLVEVIEEKLCVLESRAEGLVEELEQAIAELKRRNAELKQLSHTQDHIHFLQSFPSPQTPVPFKDIMIYNDLCVGIVSSTVFQLEADFSDELGKLMEVDYKKLEQYAVDVTLDPVTAHPNLIVSEDRKQVYYQYQNRTKFFPSNPERFDSVNNVLGKDMFTSGRHYWELSVEGKTSWYLGVAKESINRKGTVNAGPQNGMWLLHLEDDIYKALDSPSVQLSVTGKPGKVGVFVDYEEGLISFYNVEAKSHMFSFTGNTFTERLCLILNPTSDRVPLVITSVKTP